VASQQHRYDRGIQSTPGAGVYIEVKPQARILEHHVSGREALRIRAIRREVYQAA
jgi:hypothetical protein